MPYPSDLLESQPQRGLFTIGISLHSMFAFSVVLLWFTQVNYYNYYNSHNFFPRCYDCVNAVELFFGVSMVISGCTVTAYSTIEHLVVHYFGAASYFACGIVCMSVNTYISKRQLYNHIPCIGNLWIVLTIISIICILAYLFGRLFLPLSGNRYFVPHISEWILALCLWGYICSFAWDFYRIHFTLTSYEVTARRGVSRNKETQLMLVW